MFLAVVSFATFSGKSGDPLIYDIDIFFGQSLLFFSRDTLGAIYL